MATNLMDLAKSYLTSEIIHKLSANVGESPQHVEKGIEAGIPSILAGLLNSVSSSNASGLVDMLKQAAPELGSAGGLDGVLGNLGGLLSGGSSATLIKYGQTLLSFLFGGKLNSIIDVITKTSGMKNSSASSLLAILAPMIMGLIKKETASNGLSLASLTSLLVSQKDLIAKFAPAGLSSAMGLKSLTDLGSAADSLKSASTGAAREFGRTASAAASEGASWLRWAAPLALVAAALLSALYFFSRPKEPAQDLAAPPVVANTARPIVDPVSPPQTRDGKAIIETMSRMVSVSLPGDVKLDVPENSYLPAMVKFFTESKDGQPKSFVADNLTFSGATPELTTDSSTAIKSLATVLKAFDTAKLKIEAHTDNSGDPAENKKASVARATAVKDALVHAGVPADRITAAGVGADRPLASDDTADGRARNRRIELSVVSK
jgi:OmpA-OmpF porin, OOP family